MFKPDMYKKSVFDINYPLLKEKGIKCLIFDLDNTLALLEQRECPEEIKKLITDLKKDFFVLIISNNVKKRIIPYEKALGVDSVSFALKPFTFGLRQVVRKYHFKKCEMAMIGDQIPTDIFSGNRFHILTILVEPLAMKDLKITSFNRFIERRIINHHERRGDFKKGEYYDRK